MVPGLGGENEEEGGRQGVEARKVSKAEVLDMATKHIWRLERGGDELQVEHEELQVRLTELNRIWAESGGVGFP